MKVLETRLASLLGVVLLLAASCSSSGEAAEAPTPVPESATVTPQPDEPTTTPEPTVAAVTVSDDDIIAAAIAQLDEDIANGSGPDDTAVYDLLGTALADNGNVTLSICTWNRESVFNQVRDSLYATTVDDDGTITATHITSPLAGGECLNTHMIETAIDHIDAYDVYWTEVSLDPSIFASDIRAAELLSIELQSVSAELTAQWVADGLYFEEAFIPGNVRASATAELLWRRYVSADVEVLEFVVCRDMNEAVGAYRDGVLIRNNRGEQAGLDSVTAYQVSPGPASTTGWYTEGVEGLDWSDCLESGDWPSAANQWRERKQLLEVLPR